MDDRVIEILDQKLSCSLMAFQSSSRKRLKVLSKNMFIASFGGSLLKHLSKELVESIVKQLDLKVKDEKNLKDLFETVQANYSFIKAVEDTTLTPSDDPMLYVRFLQEARGGDNEEK